ncbi:hypothetical protein E5676_scaffold14G001050 [Cucumis melo var. makuwa]|uniref:Uncharacterized protein n=1 Tax=Cucumis melo var. makuwa TaxID=1194695 RepID=A0A5D3DRS5_CUCMM|nr:hypothetical protein E6C27_scaffold38G001420 [Cucumis melo var. makuwa]TYK26323.1 hypothetical protein E5676_scaffold14G001050 [Cucumis melo var. makuwa]
MGNRECAHNARMMEEKRKKKTEERREKEKAREKNGLLRQTFKEKKKNVLSSMEVKTKLAEIQNAKKKKQEMIVSLSEHVESVAARSKVVEHQELDRVDVVVKELSREIEGMSHWNQGHDL